MSNEAFFYNFQTPWARELFLALLKIDEPKVQTANRKLPSGFFSFSLLQMGYFPKGKKAEMKSVLVQHQWWTPTKTFQEKSLSSAAAKASRAFEGTHGSGKSGYSGVSTCWHFAKLIKLTDVGTAHILVQHVWGRVSSLKKSHEEQEEKLRSATA